MGVRDWFSKKPQKTARPVRVKSSENLNVTEFAKLYASSLAADAPIDIRLFRSLGRVRALAREAMLTNPIVRKAGAAWVNGVVGSGSQLRVDCRRRDLIESEWAKWGRTVDVGGDLSWAGLERLIVRELLTSGEFLALIDRGRDGLRLRPLDAWRVWIHKNERLRDGGVISMGVERDAGSRVTALHVQRGWTAPVSGVYRTGDTVRVPIENCVWVVNRQYAEQTRGIPLLGSVLERVNSLDDYETTELDRSVADARRVGFVVDGPDGQGAYDPDDVEEPDVDGYDLVSLPSGAQFQNWTSDHPSPKFADFTESVRSAIAAGTEALASFQITGDYSKTNFTSGRLARIDGEISFKQMREKIVRSVHDKIFREWLASGVVQVGGATMMDACDTAVFQFSAPPHIQPREQAAANETNLKLRLKSRSEIITEEGRDPVRVFAEIAREEQMLQELGLTQTPQQPEQQEQEEETRLRLVRHHLGNSPGQR